MGRLSDRNPISIAPGGPYADKGEPTDYTPTRGGHYPPEERPVPAGGGDRSDDGRNSGLGGRR